jgi:hypothetical protein
VINFISSSITGRLERRKYKLAGADGVPIRNELETMIYNLIGAAFIT